MDLNERTKRIAKKKKRQQEKLVLQVSKFNELIIADLFRDGWLKKSTIFLLEMQSGEFF